MSRDLQEGATAAEVATDLARLRGFLDLVAGALRIEPSEDPSAQISAAAFALGQLQGERVALRRALAALLTWCDHTGGWDAPCWNEARRALGREVTPDSDPEEVTP